MVKRLIIHIGPHKTGTTSIQRMLYQLSRDADATFDYPLTDSNQLGHHHIADAIYRNNSRELDILIEKINNSQKICVLSSEEFCYLPLDSLRKLKAQLPDVEISIIYYARDCLKTTYSWWQEQVKHGSVEIFLEFTLRCLINPGNFHLLLPDLMLTNWASVFGRDTITIFLFDEVVDVARQFARDVLDVILPKNFPTVANESYDYIESEMIRLWNSLGVRGSDLIQIPCARDLYLEIGAASRAFTKEFGLTYALPGFARFEDSLLANWRTQIRGSIGDHLFEKRERSYPYLHPDFWITHADLVTRMRELAVHSPFT